MSQFSWINERLTQRRQEGLTRHLRPVKPISGTMKILCEEESGQTRELINFGSNDYLGLASVDNLPKQQSGSGASALVTGFSTEHRDLQIQLAAFESTEAALLFPTGFAANLGTISALAQAGDMIVSDAANHASIIDGCRLSKARRFIYPHADTKAVEMLLEEHRSHFQRAYIITDSVFSMDGDLAPLERLADLADQFDAILIADEAHGTGVYGATGSGACEHLNVKHRVPIRIGTLSKALGALGGFVAGPQVVIDYLINHARSLIYSTAMPPIIARAALQNLEIVRREPQRRQRLFALADRLRSSISANWDVCSSEGQIVPIIVGENETALSMSHRLASEGYFVPAIRPPTVPSGQARLRVSVSSLHTEDDVDGLAAALLQMK